MKISKNLLIIVMIILAVIVMTFVVRYLSYKNYDNLAKCLTQKGVKMYGAYWCPHCIAQKKMFGSSWQYMDYVECEVANSREQAEVCQQVGIGSYPTWVFPEGQRIEREISIDNLAKLSGCGID